MITIANANALHIPLPDQSVQCIVTSPPYYGLRDYGTAKWEGGSAECDHLQPNGQRQDVGRQKVDGFNGPVNAGLSDKPYKDICPKCGARRIDAQIGLEATPTAYVANIVAVMRECWRVLKDDGVLWINLGDSYATNPGNGRGGETVDGGLPHRSGIDKTRAGLKPKDLCGIPWRVAFALQDDGWYLRQDIIWHKPNPMPESVTDRCTKSHEYIFLLTKRARYYYDAEAIKEPASGWNGSKFTDERDILTKPNLGMSERVENSGRNRRSVWTVATQPYSGAHFATWPPKLIEPMILVGTSQRGECPHCGKAWVRVVKREYENYRPNSRIPGKQFPSESGAGHTNGQGNSTLTNHIKSTTIDWRPQCTCQPHEPIPQTVLDPFAGSGTTGAVAVKHGRRAVLLDLNTKYIDLQFERTSGVQITMPV